MKKIILVCVLLVNCVVFSQESWKPIGPDDQNQPSWSQINYASFAIDNDSHPYVFCQRLQEYSAVTNSYVRKFNGTNWEFVGSESVYVQNPGENYEYHSIALDHNSIPYIAYTNNGKVTVKKLDGSSWIFVGSSQISVDNAKYLKLQIDNNNVPYVVYSNPEYSGRITVRKFDGTSWVIVGSELFSAGSAIYTDIKFDTNNVVYVAYQDGVNQGKATVQKFNGTNWEIVGAPGFSMTLPLDNFNQQVATPIYYVSLAIDPNNTPYISYPGYVQKFNGVLWEFVGNEVLVSNTKSVRVTTVDFDGDGTPYLAMHLNYYEAIDGEIVIKKFNGTIWETLGTSLPTEFTFNEIKSTFFGIGNDNIPQIFYADPKNGMKATLRKWNGSEWQFVGEKGYSENLAHDLSSDVDSGGTIYSAYVNYGDNTPSTVNVKKFNGIAWQTLPSPPDFYALETDIKIANDGTPYIIYNLNLNPSRINNVRKWDGSSWQLVGNGTFASTYIAHLEIGSDNVPYVAYNDDLLQEAITVKKFNGNDWDVVGTSGLSPADVNLRSFALDYNNVPYIAYTNPIGGKFIKKFNGSSWVFEAAIPEDFSQDAGMALVFDSNNSLYLNTGNKVLKLVGGTWQMLGSANFENAAVTLKLDNNNVPFVAIRSSDYRMSVKYFDGVSWQNVGEPEFTAAVFTEEISLLFNHNNIPIITYGSYDAFAKYFGNETFLNSEQFHYGNATIALYPNPVKDIFSISSNDTIEEIFIYDVNGKKVLTEKNYGQSVNIEALPNGLYFVKVQTLNGSLSQKIIKQ